MGLDIPEEPKPNDPTNGKGAFGWYKPPEGSIKPLTEPEDVNTTSSTSSETNQEILFQSAAIKCAQMEDELAELLRKFPEGITDLPREEHDISFNIEKSANRQTFLTLASEELKGVRNKGELNHALIMFRILRYQPHGDITTTYELETHGIHTDEESMDKFEQLNDGSVSSRFYFSKDGKAKKVIDVPKTLELDHPFFRDDSALLEPIKSQFHNRYKMEINEGDFELAGKALQMLIDRLKPAQEKMDSGSEPGMTNS